MDADLRRWQRSYKDIPSSAGDEEIAAADTRALQEAYRLMAQCEMKPPSYEFEPTAGGKIGSMASENTLFPYFEKLILDKSLRYARVCRELARRVESESPEKALALLRAAILPGSCALGFDSYDAGDPWRQSNREQAEQVAAELKKLGGELRNFPGRAGEYDEDYSRDILLRFMMAVVEFAIHDGLWGAAFAISQRQDAWNFWLKTSMVALEERLEHRDEAWKLREECLDLLRLNDDLWGEVLDRQVSKSVITLPTPLPPASPVVEGIEATLSQLLDSKFQPLLRSMNENLQVSHAVHDRLDLVVEKLIDLDQRSELTWRQVSRLVRKQPDYEEERRGIETSLGNSLGDVWRRLNPSSRKDLVDAEYLFQQCSRWGSGWRMVVLGYCTTVERELRASYKAAKEKIFSVRNAEPTAVETLGDLIQALGKLEVWLPKSKPHPAALDGLLGSVDQLRRLNAVRIRATHPKDREVSREDTLWVREALLGNEPRNLLITVLAVRGEM